MITADKAKIMSNLHSEVTIQNRIIEAAKKGLYYAYIPGFLSCHMQDVLRHNGFKVIEVDNATKICWN